MLDDELVLQVNDYLSLIPKDNSLIASVNGKIKRLRCDKELLEAIISSIDGQKTVRDIITIYSKQYEAAQLKHLLLTLLQAGILSLKQNVGARNKKTDKKSKSTSSRPMIVGEGLLAKSLKKIVQTNEINFPEHLDDTGTDGAELTKTLTEQLKAQQPPVVIACPNEAILKWFAVINEACLATETPLLFVYFNGKDILLGPTVIPWKTPCYSCLVEHRRNFIATNSSLTLSSCEILALHESWPLSETTANKRTTQWVADLVLAEVAKILEGKTCPEYLTKQIKIPLEGSCRLTEISFTSLTTCPACSGLNKNGITLGRPQKIPEVSKLSLELKKTEKAKHHDGGLRKNSPAEAKRLLDNVFKELGVAITVTKLQAGALDGILPSYQSTIENFYNPKFPFIIRKRNNWGKGLTAEQAYLSGSFELIERISAEYYGNVEMVRAPYKEVKDIAVDIKKQIGKTYCDYEIEQFNENADIDWVWGYSLVQQKAVLVPAFTAFLTKHLFKGNFYAPMSGGLAAGTTLEDATLQGLYETIEHDSWMIYQANGLSAPSIRLDSLPDSPIARSIQEMQAAGYQVIIKYLQNDLQIPVFRTWLVKDNNWSNFASCGFGSNLNPQIALNRAVTEAKLAAPSYRRSENLSFQAPKTVGLVSERTSLFNLHQFLKTDILSESRAIDFSEIPNSSNDNVEIDIKTCISMIKKNVVNSDIVVVDLTKEILSVPVVRVLSIGLQNLFEPIQCAQDRLFQMPIKLGLRSRSLNYKELYNGSYPH